MRILDPFAPPLSLAHLALSPCQVEDGTLNTEQQMKEAQDAMDEDADILRAAMGKPPKAKPAAAAGEGDAGAGGSGQELVGVG